jgi:hypothetical protein
MKKHIVLLILFLFSFSIVSAQRFDIVSGRMSNVKGITVFNATFDYTNLEVEGFETEEAFLADKTEKGKILEGNQKNSKRIGLKIGKISLSLGLSNPSMVDLIKEKLNVRRTVI